MVQKSRDSEYVRRCAGVLTLYETGNNVSETARRCHAGRAAVRTWRRLYETAGEAGLQPRVRGREDWKATASILQQLDDLVGTEPVDLGYLRSRWSSESLALELRRQGGSACDDHPSLVGATESGLATSAPDIAHRGSTKSPADAGDSACATARKCGR